MISIKRLTTLLAVLGIYRLCCYTQPSIISFIEAGQNKVVNRGYFCLAVIPSFDFKKNNIDAGVLWTFGGQREVNFAGLSLKATRRFSFLRQSFAISGSYLMEPFSNELRQINYSLILNYRVSNFQFDLGNNYRIYRLSKAFIRSNNNFSDNYKIVEPGNLIYTFQYSVKRKEESWNISVSLTNYDFFIIEQEKNPMVLLGGTYLIKQNISLFADLGLKYAGFSNYEIEFFGYFFRLGMEWNIRCD